MPHLYISDLDTAQTVVVCTVLCGMVCGMDGQCVHVCICTQHATTQLSIIDDVITSWELICVYELYMCEGQLCVHISHAF